MTSGRVLLVEGELDRQVLAVLRPLAGVGVEPGGSKSSLPPKARERREKTGAVVWYLRDRDFDYDPPSFSGHLSVDKRHGERQEVLGWRWCRHSIESYLLDPQVVEAAMGWPSDEYGEKLREAGRKIAGYTAVRWALGAGTSQDEDLEGPATMRAGPGRAKVRSSGSPPISRWTRTGLKVWPASGSGAKP